MFHDAERDATENAESAVPVGQEVRVEAVWVAEVFPPSLVGALWTDLRKLGWDADPDRAGREPISHYIRDQRQSAGGWVSLQLILRPGDKRFLGSFRRAELPIGVDRASAAVYSPYPSLSVVLVEFVLDDSAAMRLDTALRADYRTEVTPVGVALNVVTPALLKEREAAAVRSEMRQVCREFMQRSLHGRFATAADGLEHPALELITTSLGVVFGDDIPAPGSLSQLLRVSWKFDTWTTRRGPRMRLRREDSWAGLDTNTLVMNGNGPRLIAEAKEHGYGMPTAADLLTHAGNEITALWATRRLIDGYQTELDQARDRLLTPARRSLSRSAIKRLRAMDETILAISADVRVVTADVAQFAPLGRAMLTKEAPQFWPMEKKYGGTRPFSVGLLEEAESRAQRLRSREAELRDLLAVDASTKGAIASIRMQRWLVILTVVIAAMTALLVWLALQPNTTPH